MTQQEAYDYIEGLIKQAKPYYNQIEEQWGTLTLEDVNTICYRLEELVRNAQDIYDRLDSDTLDIIKLVHWLEYTLQDAEDLLNEKDNEQ